MAIPRGSRDHIKAASTKKRPLLRIFTVFDLSENMSSFLSDVHR